MERKILERKILLNQKLLTSKFSADINEMCVDYIHAFTTIMKLNRTTATIEQTTVAIVLMEELRPLVDEASMALKPSFTPPRDLKAIAHKMINNWNNIIVNGNP